MKRARLVTAASLAGAGRVAGAIGARIMRNRRAARQSICSDCTLPQNATSLHARKVERIAAQLRAHDGDRPVSLRKKAPPHQVPKGGDLRRRDDKIDISDLTQILVDRSGARASASPSRA